MGPRVGHGRQSGAPPAEDRRNIDETTDDRWDEVSSAGDGHSCFFITLRGSEHQQTTKASNSQIYNKVVSEVPYIDTGNNVSSYFRSAANRVNVSILGHVRAAISH